MNAKFDQVVVDPIGAIPLVARELVSQRHDVAIVIGQFNGVDKFFDALRFVLLSWRNMNGERIPIAVAHEVDFC